MLRYPRGVGEIRGNATRDLAALQKVEMAAVSRLSGMEALAVPAEMFG